MPKKRPRKTNAELEQQIEAFGDLAEISEKKVDFEQLSLDDLVKQFYEIEQQSHLLKGKIILAARSKFNSDRQFGKWLSDNLSELNQKQAHRLMCLAEFFDEKSKRSMKGISISACYELSAPKNRPFAKEIYFEVSGRSYPLAVVREKLEAKANEYYKNDVAESETEELEEHVTPELPSITAESNDLNEEPLEQHSVEKQSSFNRKLEMETLINDTLSSLNVAEKLRFLTECISLLKEGKI